MNQEWNLDLRVKVLFLAHAQEFLELRCSKNIITILGRYMFTTHLHDEMGDAHRLTLMNGGEKRAIPRSLVLAGYW